MKVTFAFYPEGLREPEEHSLNDIPRIGDSIMIDGELFSVKAVMWIFKEGSFTELLCGLHKWK